MSQALHLPLAAQVTCPLLRRDDGLPRSPTLSDSHVWWPAYGCFPLSLFIARTADEVRNAQPGNLLPVLSVGASDFNLGKKPCCKRHGAAVKLSTSQRGIASELKRRKPVRRIARLELAKAWPHRELLAGM